jgi:four helix bundle protein
LKENLIQDKSFNFAIRIIHLYKQLIDKKEFVLSKQLLRSATSVGANIEEAIGGFSKRDFTAKMGIALKEARETKYWLRLIHISKIVEIDVTDYIKESEEIVKNV